MKLSSRMSPIARHFDSLVKRHVLIGNSPNQSVDINNNLDHNM